MRHSQRHLKGVTGSATPRSQRSGLGPHSTVLISLDVLIHRANIGRDVSPHDEDLIVLFRRNSKEVASEPTRWNPDHCAVWNEHMSIQTSLLRHKKPDDGTAVTEFHNKEYEIVLVALPSHSAVALFSLDFATLVQLHASPRDRHKSFRLPPLKCRDLAATLEFDITWDLVSPSRGSQVNTTANMMLQPTSNMQTGLAGLPPSSTLLNKNTYAPSSRSSKSRRGANESIMMQARRTTASSGSADSERDLLDDSSTANCSNCRTAKRRLDRKEVQVLQLESFLKESQKRIDSLVAENEELVVREKAETRNAVQQRALSLRLLQELETAVQLCNEQMGVQDPTLLPQWELIQRVKKFHTEVDPLHEHSDSLHSLQKARDSPNIFDFRAEMEVALQRNQRLQEQLEFLGRSMDYDNEEADVKTRAHRVATDASGTTISSVCSGSVNVDSVERPVALTMTQQLNNLERENFRLRSELEGALANAKSALKKNLGGYPARLTKGLSLTAEISETTSSSSREDIEELENDDAAQLAQIQEQHKLEAGRSAALESKLDKANDDIKRLKDQLEVVQNESQSKTDVEQPSQTSGFLDKIYADVGKAKSMLEDRVKQLDEMLVKTTEENSRLRNEIEQLQKETSNEQKQATTDESDAQVAELEKLLKKREEELKTNEVELAQVTSQLQDAEERARTGESVKLELESELASAQLSLKVAQEAATKFENQLTVALSSVARGSAASTSFAGPNSTTSDTTGHDEVADLQKQLKLSKQEVMQLRFRSNQFESVNERLEEALKEKRTLEVKLTALEGQLFEQRSRSINTDTSSYAASALDAKNCAMLAEIQRELDQKSAQLMIAEREVEHLRSQCNEQGDKGPLPGNIDDMADKVKQLESKIMHLCQRNDEQAKRLEKLGNRITVAVHERDELDSIVQQMMTEMSLLGKTVEVSAGTCSPCSPSIAEDEVMEEKSLPRFQPSTGRSANSNSKVAQLVKSFSTPCTDDDGPLASKRPDFRYRKDPS